MNWKNRVSNTFQKGDIVKFIEGKGMYNNHYPYQVMDYKTETMGLPSIRHGSTIMKENKGTIIDTYGEYYIVEYIDKENKKVALGFTSSQIEHY